MLHLKKGMTVKIISGDDKGKEAKVLRVLPDKNMVVVQGMNIAKKHVRPSRKNPQGGILRIEKPIHMSNVLPVSTGSEKKATRIKYVTENGKKVRVAKADNSKIII